MEDVEIVDIFSLTSHVETIALLSRKNVIEHIYVEYEPKDKDVHEFREATYEEIKEWVRENYGFNVSNLYIGQAKEKYGLDKRPNFNLPRSESPIVPECPPEKMEAIEAAFRYFRMMKG